MSTTPFPAGASMAWEEALRAGASLAKLCQSWNFEVRPCCHVLVFYIDDRHLDQLKLGKFWNFLNKFTQCPRLKNYPFPLSYQHCEWIVLSPWSRKISGFGALTLLVGGKVAAEGSAPSACRRVFGFGGSMAVECSTAGRALSGAEL